MLVRLPCSLARTEEHRVRAPRVEERELVKREALAARLRDAGARRVREAKRGNAERRQRVASQADVVSDRADNDGDLRLLALRRRTRTGAGQHTSGVGGVQDKGQPTAM